MRKNFANLLIVRAYQGLKPLSSIGGTGAISAEFIRENAEIQKRLKRKSRLQKIGGMAADVRAFLSFHCNESEPGVSILRTSASESINRLPENATTIVNLKRVNDIREINKFFDTVNRKLPEGGTFIGCVETKYLRRQRIFKKFPPVLNRIYYMLDFLLKRVFPKLPLTRRIYYLLTAGRNKVLSRTETLGRLYAAGFEVKENQFIGNNLWFVARKVKKPLFDHELKYGHVFKMRRHGKNGKFIYIYKVRTMHAYSEFIQQYVYDHNNLAEGGKMKDDFRVSSLGKLLRKYWIDELPMIWNLLKGDLKLVGVRPLSSQFLSLYAEKVKEKRSRHTPGMIPPFYADMPKTLDEIQASEMKYLVSYEKNPLLTDVRYFFLACYNIVFKKARSC